MPNLNGTETTMTFFSIITAKKINFDLYKKREKGRWDKDGN